MTDILYNLDYDTWHQFYVRCTTNIIYIQLARIIIYMAEKSGV